MQSKKGRIILVSLLSLGFTSTFTQIYLIREFLDILYGNELVIGIVLACWMLLTGVGAWLGRFFGILKGKKGFILFLQVLLTLLPFLMVLKLDLWRMLALPYGSMVELTDILYASLMVQLPFCLLNGFLFSAYSSMASEYSGSDRAGSAYAWESAGSVLGGLVVNFILLWYFGPLTALKILMLVNVASSLLFAGFLCRKQALVAMTVVFLLTIPVFFLVDFSKLKHEWLFPKQQVIFDRSTPSGTVVVAKNAGQLNFYENGLLLFSSGNEILSEEAVHYAMIQHPSPRKVLLISGGVAGMIKEVKKYHPKEIDYLELNPSVTAIGKEYTGMMNDPSVKVYNEDARRFLMTREGKYDAALINLPEPSTLQVNRFYSTEFFRILKSRLNPGAVVSISLASTADYVSNQAARLNGSLLSTLKGRFLNVMIMPGQRNYYIASDGPLTTNISATIAAKGIHTVYANPYYVDDQLTSDRRNFILGRMPEMNKINYDFSPVTFFYQLQYWTTYFSTNYIVLLSVITIVLLLILLSLNPVSIGLFTGGFTASSAFIMLILAFQVFYGFVFRMTGIMIMLFMAGLALGSFLRNRRNRVPSVGSYIAVQVGMGLFTLVFPFIIIVIHQGSFSDLVNYSVIGLMTFAVSILAGLEYSLATSLQIPARRNVVPKNYSADLFGSALGAFLTSIILLPLAGIIYTSLILVFMNFISIIFLVASSTGKNKILKSG